MTASEEDQTRRAIDMGDDGSFSRRLASRRSCG
jgi:hypothetical protein